MIGNFELGIFGGWRLFGGIYMILQFGGNPRIGNFGGWGF